MRLESVRALIALSVEYGLELHQVDVTTVFLNGELEEEVFMEQPDPWQRTSSLQAEEEHIWTQTISSMLERGA